MNTLVNIVLGWPVYAATRAGGLLARVGYWRTALAAAGVAIAMTMAYPWWTSSTPRPSVPPTVELGLVATAPAETLPADEPQPEEPLPAQPEPATAHQTQTPEIISPFSRVSLQEEQAQRALQLQLERTQKQVEITRQQVELAQQEQELARVQQATHALFQPPRQKAPPPVPPVPEARVLAVSSQAAVVVVEGTRLVVQPGMRLGGWTVQQLLPDGIALGHDSKRAFLPLAFAGPQ